MRFDRDYTAKKRNDHLIIRRIMSRNNPSFPLRGSRLKVPARIELRHITFEEALSLGHRDNVFVVDRQGRAATVRVNSAVKRWKTDPTRIEISFAFGMYEKFRLNTAQILNDIYVEV